MAITCEIVDYNRSRRELVLTIKDGDQIVIERKNVGIELKIGQEGLDQVRSIVQEMVARHREKAEGTA